MNNWDLNKLYESYESENFQNDLLKLDELIKTKKPIQTTI
jgi:hypothetical protein